MSIREKIVDYEEKKEDIEHWFMLKGEFRYERIIKFMLGKSIPCTWENVTNYIKYDKRILINSFKYIVFLEEFYKSMISKNKKYDEERLIAMDFKVALQKYLSIGEKAKYDEMNLKVLKEKMDLINDFRNSVAHNKILLDRTFFGNDLEESLNIIIEILPKSYRSGFKKDINNCNRGMTDGLWHIILK